MASKYLIVGATYYGDGTSSSEAASNGGAGAWNDAAILQNGTPTYGTLAAGDTVNIRSKDHSGANISITVGAAISMGSANATSGSPIRWVLDDGTIWSGVNGTLTFNVTGSYTITGKDYNQFIARTAGNWIISSSYAAYGSGQFVSFGIAQVADGLRLDMSFNTTSYGGYINFSANQGYVTTMKNLSVKSYARYLRLFQGGNYGGVVMITPDIELQSASETDPVFLSGSYGNKFIVHGGRIHGAGVAGVPISGALGTGSSGVEFYATDIPKTMAKIPSYPNTNVDCGISAFGLDGGAGAILVRGWGEASSRNDGYFPTLDAVLPDSTSDGWSWWIYPAAASDSFPLNMPISQKVFTGTAATATLTLEMLIADSLSWTADDIWVDFSYIDDSTGAPVLVSTRDYSAGALTSSTAAWSASTYGAVNFNKYKFEITTPSSIKQNTIVQASLFCRKASVSSNDILFADPSVQLA